MTANELIQNIKTKYDEIHKDSEKAKELMEKALELEEYDLLATLAITEQRPDAHLVATMGHFRKLNYTVRAHAKGILIPLPVTKLSFKREGKYVSIALATKEEKLGIAKGEIASKKDRTYVWMMGYDIQDTDCPKEEYEKLKKYRYNDVSYNDIYKNLSSYAERMGFDVATKQLPGISGFYDEKTDNIRINHTVPQIMLSSLCENLAKGIINHTTTQKPETRGLEADMLTRLLKYWCRVPTNLEGLDFSKSEHLNKNFGRMMKASDFICKGINEEMDLSRQEEQGQSKSVSRSEEVDRTMVSENFMMDL